LIAVRWTERRPDVRLDLIARQFLEEVAERAKRFTYSRVKLASLFSFARVNRFACSCEEVRKGLLKIVPADNGPGAIP
jgi:hypothetical protein